MNSNRDVPKVQVSDVNEVDQELSIKPQLSNPSLDQIRKSNSNSTVILGVLNSSQESLNLKISTSEEALAPKKKKKYPSNNLIVQVHPMDKNNDSLFNSMAY